MSRTLDHAVRWLCSELVHACRANSVASLLVSIGNFLIIYWCIPSWIGRRISCNTSNITWLQKIIVPYNAQTLYNDTLVITLNVCSVGCHFIIFWSHKRLSRTWCVSRHGATVLEYSGMGNIISYQGVLTATCSLVGLPVAVHTCIYGSKCRPINWSPTLVDHIIRWFCR